MLLFLKTAAIILGMSLIIPVAVWGMSGRLIEGLRAWRTWLFIMGALSAPGFIAYFATSAFIG
jgi:hypothetical protein